MSSDDQRPEPDDAKARPATDPEPDTDTEAGTATEDTEVEDEPSASGRGRKTDDDSGTGESVNTRRSARSGPPRPLMFATAALASAALVVAIVFGVMWQSAASSDELEIAQARDEVSAAANRAAAVFLEFDHTRSDELLAERKKLSTDAMSAEIDETEKEWRESIEKAQLKTVTTVQDVAVEELNVHEGKARALAVVQIEVTNAQGSFGNVERLQLELERDQQGDGSDEDRQWKVSALANVQYGASG
ncbi:hypothetical protein [Saccharomonospora sp.]|uniref:hypothetical protein n=1 Tax=Saccharomonospora sp. TaxID=33913 RepID=UPI002605A963|nr:hypothetical protein [Saccharomonospora sp.]